MPSSHIQLEGEWIGKGVEKELLPDGSLQTAELSLVTYLINTGGNNEKFISSDSFGIGIDFYNVEGKHMKYRYNINGATPNIMADIPSEIQPFTSLDGTFKLKRH